MSLDRLDHPGPNYSTPDDFHQRRPGEPIGYEPNVGDRIRYALRHTRWSVAARRMLDGHDEQAEMGDVVTVVSRFEDPDAGYVRYGCRDARGQYSGIDLEWWICEPVIVDGQLW